MSESSGGIPAKGKTPEEILATMTAFKEGDADWHSGRTFSLVYHGGDEHLRLLQDAYSLFISENLLNPMAFKSLKRMEHEVVRMTADMLHGGPDAVGSMSSGGTESILLAVKTYRDRARRKRPWIRRPEMVVPQSIHVAFEKAAKYFGLRFVKVPLDDDFRVNVKALRRRIGHNTVMIAASAPQFPHGVIDPIEEIAQLALQHKLPFHVDGCIGGFLLPWIERLGIPLPRWDYRVPGVSSISADAHKFGYASKGASVVTYRDMSYMRDQFFISTDFPGGVYAGPTMAGSRPGGAVAAAWAAMMYMGQDGYLEMARQTMEITGRYLDGVSKISGVKVLGQPQMSLVAIASDDPAVDIYVLGDQLEERGWEVDRQQFPASLHVTLTSNHGPVLDQYLADLRDSVQFVRAHPELGSEGKAAMYGMMAKIPVRGMVRLSVQKIMEGMYGPTGEVPDLSRVGEGENAAPLLKLVDRYGARAMALWEKVEGLVRKVGLKRHY